MIEQTEAERQAIEQAKREQEDAERRTAEADASMNRLLRGEPSKEQEEQRKQVSEKARKRLEKLAVDESEDAETRQWAQNVLDGKVTLNGDPINKTKPKSADGGAGASMSTPQWDPFRPKTLTEQAREALLDKRYGKRHTQNHLLPRGNE